MRSALSLNVGVLLIGGLVLLSGCGKQPAETAEPPVVTVATPIVKDVTEYEDFTGTTVAVETVDVKARVFGYLQEIKFKEGDYVKKGDLLFVIDPSTYKAEVEQSKAQVRLADAQVSYAEVEYKRNQTLRPTGAVSQDDLDKALRGRDVAVAQLASSQADLARRQLDLDFCQIRAPISGRISRTQLTLGNLVQGGQGMSTLLTTIVSVDPIYAYFDVDERTLLRVQKLIREGKFRSVRDQTRNTSIAATTTTLLLAEGLPGMLASLGSYFERILTVLPVKFRLANDDGYPYDGYVDFVNNVVASSTGTITVRAIIKNDNSIFTPGLFVRVRLPIGGPHPALLITERAVGTNQGEKYVYVLNDKNEVVYRPVTLGQLQDGLREVEGLQATDRVIINGLLRVRPGLVVNPKTAEMTPERKSSRK